MSAGRLCWWTFESTIKQSSVLSSNVATGVRNAVSSLPHSQLQQHWWQIWWICFAIHYHGSSGWFRIIPILGQNQHTMEYWFYGFVCCIHDEMVKLVIAQFDVQYYWIMKGLVWMLKSLLVLEFHKIAFSRPSPASYKLIHSSHIQPANSVLQDWLMPPENSPDVIGCSQILNSLPTISLACWDITCTYYLQPAECSQLKIVFRQTIPNMCRSYIASF